jgi:diaminopimelate decarboxylase
LRAGFPADRIHFHGNNKTPAELAQALSSGVGSIVVDHPGELVLLDELARGQGRRQSIWLRINPDVDVDTHGHTRTGHATSKFGLSLADGTAEAVARQALQLQGVRLAGLHCHVGSQFREAGPLVLAVERLLALAASLAAHTGWQPDDLSPGGGWAVPYHPDQVTGLTPVEAYVPLVAQAVVDGCRLHRLKVPRLVLEPGRSLVARAGVALYTVGAVKQAGSATYVFVDGGLADNPRPALYEARYTAVVANRPDDTLRRVVQVAGPYCETGDVLIHDIELPAMHPGDLLAVPVGGAYQLSMSSNYNAARRPAVVWVENGEARLVQRRETVEDLLARDAV